MTGGALIITGTMSVGDTPFVAVRETEVRILEYLCSFVEWITRTSVHTITYSDNSRCAGLDLGAICAFAERHGKTFRVRPFAGNRGAQTRGKGHGEGESLEHALAGHGVSPFYKVTGRLFVPNFDEIARRHSEDPNVVGIVEGQRGYMDTRFFKMDPLFYGRTLAGKHEEVDDPAGRHLEHVYHDALAGVSGNLVRFALRPSFIGRSATNGNRYEGDYGPETVLCARRLRGELTAAP